MGLFVGRVRPSTVRRCSTVMTSQRSLNSGLRPAVAHRHSGEVWLEGDLERGIVPDSCVWTAGEGAGEDGFLVLLEKMNLELLRRCAASTRNGCMASRPSTMLNLRSSIRSQHR